MTGRLCPICLIQLNFLPGSPEAPNLEPYTLNKLLKPCRTPNLVPCTLNKLNKSIGYKVGGFEVRGSLPIRLLSLLRVQGTKPRTPNLVPYTLIKLIKGTGYEVRGSRQT